MLIGTVAHEGKRSRLPLFCALVFPYVRYLVSVHYPCALPSVLKSVTRRRDTVRRAQPTPIALCCLDSKGSYRNRSPARSCVCALLSSTLTSMPHPSRLLFIVVAVVHRGDAGAACLQIYRPLRISLQSISSDEGASSTSPVHSRTGTQGDKTLTGDFAGEGLAGDTASCCATISGESDEP